MSDMSATEKILADLPKIGAIAHGPLASNPMLAALIEQASALAQIARWAQDAQRGLDAERSAGPPSLAEVLGVPDEAITELPVPSRNGKRA